MQEVSHQARHGRTSSCLSSLETFPSVFLRHSSLLKAAIPVPQCLLEAAQRQEGSTRPGGEGVVTPPTVLPFSPSASEPLQLAVEFGQGTVGSTG